MVNYTCLSICLIMMHHGFRERSKVAAQNSLDQPPVTMAAYLNDLVYFSCYVRQSSSNLFFYVNSTPVSLLPQSYDIRSFSINPLGGVGSNRTLQIRALKEANNSLIVCGVDTTGSIIDREYFPSPASLLVQGLPLPLIDHELNTELISVPVSIVLTWQKPRGLIIEDDVTFLISINISGSGVNNFSNHTIYYHENQNLSYTHYFEEDIEVCDFIYLSVSISVMNKVGTGEVLQREVNIGSFCKTTTESDMHSVKVTELRSEANMTACSSSTGDNGCKNNTIPVLQPKSTLIYAGATTGVSVLMLTVVVVTILITCICRKQVKSGKANITSKDRGERPKLHLQPDTNPNEAYACTMTLKANAAYETRNLPCVCETNTNIVLEHNQAYQSCPAAQTQMAIYEEIPTVHLR